jgi:hypothetical protein
MPMTNNASDKRSKHVNRNSNLLILLAIAIVGGLSYLIINSMKSPYDVSEESQRFTEARHVLALQAFERYADGHEKLLDHSMHPGEKVVFKLSTSHPVHIALAMSVGENSPVIIYQGARVPPGPDRLIAKLDQPFVYTADDSEEKTRICVLAGDDERDVRREMGALGENWSILPDSTCLQLRQ